MKNYTITVNGTVYEVSVEEGGAGSAPVRAAAPKAAPKAPAAAPAAAAPAASAGSIEVTASVLEYPLDKIINTYRRIWI